MVCRDALRFRAFVGKRVVAAIFHVPLKIGSGCFEDSQSTCLRDGAGASPHWASTPPLGSPAQLMEIAMPTFSANFAETGMWLSPVMPWQPTLGPILPANDAIRD
jgi:hypothetical protein